MTINQLPLMPAESVRRHKSGRIEMSKLPGAVALHRILPKGKVEIRKVKQAAPKTAGAIPRILPVRTVEIHKETEASPKPDIAVPSMLPVGTVEVHKETEASPKPVYISLISNSSAEGAAFYSKSDTTDI